MGWRNQENKMFRLSLFFQTPSKEAAVWRSIDIFYEYLKAAATIRVIVNS